MRVASIRARRKRIRHVVLVAAPWLLGCSFLADLDVSSGGDPPGTSPEAGDAKPTGTDGADTGSRDTGPVDESYATAVRADTPSAYWRFGERSGTTAKDEMGAHSGVYEQGFTLGAEGIAGSDGAVRLDGKVGTRIRIGDVFDFGENGGSALEAWVKWDGNGYGYIFSKRGDQSSGNNGYELSLFGDGSGTVQWNYSRTTRGASTPVLHSAPLPNEFVHVVAAFDGTTGRLYLNGEEVATASYNNSFVGSGAILVLGNTSNGGSGAFQGTLDELAIYEHTLSADRVRAHYLAATSK